jgi:dTDP-4-dehydrorhamnose 3,5-epimerase
MIKDVIIRNIISNNDKRGFFREIFRPDKINKKIPIKQISHSFIKKNIIKAWHVHKDQYQWNYLLKGRIKVTLIDLRKESKTFKNVQTFEILENKNKSIYFFPPGIAHGYITKNIENHMIYGTSGYYNIKEEYKVKPSNEDILNYFK